MQFKWVWPLCQCVKQVEYFRVATSFLIQEHLFPLPVCTGIQGLTCMYILLFKKILTEAFLLDACLFDEIAFQWHRVIFVIGGLIKQSPLTYSALKLLILVQWSIFLRVQKTLDLYNYMDLFIYQQCKKLILFPPEFLPVSGPLTQ